jgi:rhamnogalacturonan endolyase
MQARTYARLTAGILTVLLTLTAGAPAAERLDRGLVVRRCRDGIDAWAYLGWRLLAEDPPDVAFHVYRKTADGPFERLTDKPVADSTNYVDQKASEAAIVRYAVAPVAGGKEGERSRIVPLINEGPQGASSYIRIPLKDGEDFQKVGVGDLDGDGRYDYVVKRPNFNTDPYQHPGYWKRSPEPYTLDAYSADGDFLWRHDMGWAIETGIWYSPFVVYDADGDGRAELYAKGGEGDPREPTGHVRSGPEWLFKVDGRTGEVVERVPWPSREGVGKYNYYCRNFLAVAYLDGKRPHVVVERGTYQHIRMEAYGPDLKPVWKWFSADDAPHFRHQGAHTLLAADVDADGRQELVMGSGCLDENGKALWCTGMGHPDICFVGDIDPRRQGMEVFLGYETRQKTDGVCLLDARTGEKLWACKGPTYHVHSQGMCGDILADRPGQECYCGEKNKSQYWLYAAGGERLGKERIGGLAPWTVWWDADPQKELLYGRKVRDYEGKTWLDLAGMRRAALVADVLGDWREEIITSHPGEIRIYTTTIPATTRRTCLMQDRHYRTYVATSGSGYHTPPQHSKPFAWGE